MIRCNLYQHDQNSYDYVTCNRNIYFQSLQWSEEQHSYLWEAGFAIATHFPHLHHPTPPPTPG